MIAEYTYMFVNCCLITTLFLGGWKGIPLPFGRVQLLHLVFYQSVSAHVYHRLVPLDISPRAL